MNVHDARSRLWLRLKLLVLSASVLFLAGCASSEKWGWYVISPTTKQGRINIEFLLSGVGWTVALTVCCVLLSIALGFVLYLPALSRNRYVNLINRVLVELFRSIPPLVSSLRRSTKGEQWWAITPVVLVKTPIPPTSNSAVATPSTPDSSQQPSPAARNRAGDAVKMRACSVLIAPRFGRQLPTVSI